MEETAYIEEVEQQEPDPKPKPKKVKVKEFAAKIKEKYPDYKDIDDLVLTQKIIDKYPEYKEQVDFTPDQPPTEKKNPVGKDVPTPSKDTNYVSETLSLEEEIPIVTDYGNGEVLNPKDPIALAKAADDFSKRGEMVITGGGVGGASKSYEPDIKSIKASEEIIKDLDKQGFKADFLIGIKDLPEDAYNTPETSKETLVEIYKENPLRFKQLTNEAKTKYAIRNAAFQTSNENIPDGEGKENLARYNAILESNAYSGDEVKPLETMDDLRIVIGGKQESINRNIRDEDTKKKLQATLRDTYGSYINPESLNVREEYESSPVKSLVDINQFAGLETLRIFEPEKYQNYLNIIQQKITPQYNVNVNVTPEEQVRTITTDSAMAKKLGGKISDLTISEQIGQETVLRELNAIGLGNSAEQLTSLRNDLVADSKNVESQEEFNFIKQKYDETIAKLDNLSKLEKQDDERYPVTAQLKFDAQVKETVGQMGVGAGEWMYNKYAHGVGTSVDAVENLVTTLFGSDEDKTQLSMKRIGEQQKFDASIYLPEELRRLNSPVILQIPDELKKEANKILNGRKLKNISDEERKQLNELMAKNQDKIQTVTNPEAGKSKNFFSKATALTVGGFTSEIAAFMTKMAIGRGIGLSNKAAEATTLFMDGYVPAVNQKLAEGKSLSEANEYGILQGGVLSTMVLFGSKYEAVKKIMEGGKSPLSKQIAGMGEEAWNQIYNKNKSLIERLGKSAKNIGKEQVKMIGTFGVVAPTASALADNVFYNADISGDEMVDNAIHGSTDMLIGSLGIIGFGLVKGSMKTKATPLEKVALWELGDNPEIGKSKIDEAVTKGDLTQAEGEIRKKTIDNVSKLIDKVPTKTDKGKLMTDEQRNDYLFNLAVQENAKQESKDLPPKQAEKSDHKAKVAEFENQLILDTPTDKQLDTRRSQLEAKLEPKKDAEGKAIEIPEKEKLDLQAELEAVNNEVETRKSFQKVEIERRDITPTVESKDFFEYDELPKNVKDIVDKYGDANDKTDFNKELEKAGYTTEYDAESFGQESGVVFRKVENKEVGSNSVVGGGVTVMGWRVGKDDGGFISKSKEYAQEYGDTYNVEGEPYQKSETFKNPLRVELPHDEFTDINAQKKYIEQAKKNGNDGVIFTPDKKANWKDEEFYVKISNSKEVIPDVEAKEGFTEGKDLNKIFADLKSKYGDKKGSAIYDAANRLVNPNKNTIVEIRGNGVVVKENGKYILKPFGNTDANSKKWTLYKGLDITDQFTSTTEKPSSKVNEEAKVTEDTNSTTETGKEQSMVTDLAPETKTGGEKEPPKEPTEPVVEEGGKDKLNDKGILNRLHKAKNLPEQTKKGLEEQGLKYKVASREEAKSVAKSVIEEFGIDEAVILAEANKFKGGANSAIFTESINMLAEMEAKATTPKEKMELAQKSAELLIRYDELSRDKGQDISYIDEFYKKSPLGVVLKENAAKKEQFEQWAKPKDKSWKEAFDEMMKEPEFEKEVSAKVKEEMKKERAENRAARIKKVDEFFDKAKHQFKSGGATYSTVIPPQVITAALEGMKQAYHAGEKVAKLVQDAVDYISEKLGNETWDKEKFRKEWEEKLKDKVDKTKLTDEEVKARILDRFRNKLKGLSDKQKEEVVLKSFKKIVEAGGLKYDEFRHIIAEVTGRSDLTESEANAIKKLVEQTNQVDTAGKRARELKTDRSLNAYKLTQIKAAQAQRELNRIIYSKPNVLKRITSLVQLNTLGATSLVVNIAYNLVNHVGIRLPIGVVKTITDLGIRLFNKDAKIETNIFRSQGEFFSKLGFGTKEAFTQFVTGMNRMDYIQKELYGQQIRPLTAIKELWQAGTGKRNMTAAQVFDNLLQALPFGWSAEVVARSLNIGDKPMRFAAEGAQQATFAKSLGLKDINYKLFIEFPREVAYDTYISKGLSETEAAKKADYIKDTIIKEGERSTFQQDNFLNDILGKVFGGSNSGFGGLVKTVTVSPYIKIPSNAFWSYFNIVNPEVAIAQAMIYGGKAYAKRNGTKTYSFDKNNSTAAKDLNEAKYWLGHAAVGYATRAVIASLVAAGIYRSSNTQDDTKKEREGEQNFEAQGTINLTKLGAYVKGEDPSKIKGGYVIANKWFGHFGSVGNTIAKREEEMTEEQKANRGNYWDEMLANIDESALPALEQGIFANSASLLAALNKGGFDAQRYGVNMVNMFTNIAHPATFAQVSKAQLPYYTKTKADSFGQELKNAMLTRSSWLRKATGQYPPSKVSIWGDTILKKGNMVEKLFGFSKANDDNFAQPLYEDYKRTNNTEFFPPAVKPNISVDGKILKLTTKEAAELEQYVGKMRKNLIAPFINGYATYDGYKYSDLKSDEQKIAALKIIYEIGKDKGEDEFIAKYPKFENKQTEKSEEKIRTEELNREFREAMKNN